MENNNNIGDKVNDAINNLTNTADTTANYDTSDIESNKIMAVLSYISWLVLIPLFAARESRFARFHVNQGLVLAIAEIIWWIVEVVVGFAIGWVPLVGTLVTGLLGLINIVFLVFAILGIINAAQGKAKELPIIGKFTILK